MHRRGRQSFGSLELKGRFRPSALFRSFGRGESSIVDVEEVNKQCNGKRGVEIRMKSYMYCFLVVVCFFFNLPWMKSAPKLMGTTLESAGIINQPKLAPKFSLPALDINLNDDETFPRKREPDLSAPRDTCCGDKYMDIIKPFNDTTVFYDSGFHQTGYGFYSGFRNQIMAFTSVIMWTRIHKWGQIIYHDSLNFKDTYGTNEYIPFDWLFDIEHWNSHYPDLPRLVSCNTIMHSDMNCEDHSFLVGKEKATSPYLFNTRQDYLIMQFWRYTKGKGPLVPETRTDVLMKQSALRPNKELLEHIEKILESLVKNGTFMTLHPRVEPDMVEHVMCKDKKETNLTKIFEYLQEAFPDPPAPYLLIPINRDLLEERGQMNRIDPSKTDWLAYENLAALNRAISEGLWNGTVTAFEFGSNSLNGTKFARYPATTGAWVNFYLAVEAELFVGSEVSTWAYGVMKTRYFRGNPKNYKYTPSGIEQWTTENMETLPNFRC